MTATGRPWRVAGRNFHCFRAFAAAIESLQPVRRIEAPAKEKCNFVSAKSAHDLIIPVDLGYRHSTTACRTVSFFRQEARDGADQLFLLAHGGEMSAVARQNH